MMRKLIPNKQHLWITAGVLGAFLLLSSCGISHSVSVKQTDKDGNEQNVEIKTDADVKSLSLYFDQCGDGCPLVAAK